MTAVVTLLSLVVALLVVLVVGLLRSHAEILRALHDLGAFADGRPRPVPVTTSAGGSVEVAPAIDLPTAAPSHLHGRSPDGELTSIALDAAEPTLVAFLTTGCVSCAGFWDALGSGAAVDGLRTIIVTRGEESESPPAVAALAPRRAPTIMSTEAWDAFHVPGAPYFVQLEGGAVVGQGVAMHWSQLLEMLGRSAVDGDAPRVSRRDLLFSRRSQRSDRQVGSA